MSKFITVITDPNEGWLDITVPPVMVEEFKQLVSRATSTWQDMSPDMRHFADRILQRDHVVGTNMKEGAEGMTYRTSRIRDCCHTMLTEPHHSQCKEKDKVASYVKPELTSSSTVECADRGKDNSSCR